MQKSDQSVHLITKSDQFFILKIFLPPDWSLSNNVLIGSYGGWAQRLLERTCDWSNFGPSGFSCLNILGYKLGPKRETQFDWLTKLGPHLIG